MPDFTPIDLARLDAWRGVKPGLRRAEVKAILEQQGLEVGEYGDNTLSTVDDEWEMEFYFAADGSERLRQLSIEDDVVLWSGRSILGVRLDEALGIIRPLEPVQWTLGDAIRKPYPPLLDVPAELPTDEQMLEESTVWLPQQGLGFVLSEGVVIGAVWRGPADLPAGYSGTVTPEQRELSQRANLEDYLREKRMERHRAQERKEPFHWLRPLITVAAILALAWIGKGGFEAMQLWNQAPQLTATFVSIEQHPDKQFCDYLPPELRWAVPPLKTFATDLYRVEYLTPTGERREALLEHGEVYIPPREPGTEVPIVYVAGPPEQVKGLARARDSAFLDYLPRAIVVGTLWLVAQGLLTVLPVVWRLFAPLLRRMIASRGVKDPDRPELS